MRAGSPDWSAAGSSSCSLRRWPRGARARSFSKRPMARFTTPVTPAWTAARATRGQTAGRFRRASATCRARWTCSSSSTTPTRWPRSRRTSRARSPSSSRCSSLRPTTTATAHPTSHRSSISRSASSRPTWAPAATASRRVPSPTSATTGCCVPSAAPVSDAPPSTRSSSRTAGPTRTRSHTRAT